MSDYDVETEFMRAYHVTQRADAVLFQHQIHLLLCPDELAEDLG